MKPIIKTLFISIFFLFFPSISVYSAGPTPTPHGAAQCTQWSDPPLTYTTAGLPPGLPGSMQSLDDIVIGNTLTQGIWHSDLGFVRTVPMVNGSPNWGNASAWYGPLAITSLPGSGHMQASNSFVIGTVAKPQLMQGIWRGDQGFSRIIPIVNGNPDWSCNTGACAWSGPLSLTNIPGSGSMQSLDDIVIGGNLTQGIWRGGQGWVRTLPMVSGIPDWSCTTGACAWSGPLDINLFPGSGHMQASNSFVIGGGNTLMQGFWRGDQGFVRTVPIVNGQVQWNTCPALPTPTSTPTPNPSCACKSDKTCETSCSFDKLTGVNYASSINCVPDPVMYVGVPAPSDLNSYCDRPKRTKGDANGDGVVDNTDYFYYVQAVNGGKIPPNVNPDFNGDGEVGTADRAIILKELNGT